MPFHLWVFAKSFRENFRESFVFSSQLSRKHENENFRPNPTPHYRLIYDLVYTVQVHSLACTLFSTFFCVRRTFTVSPVTHFELITLSTQRSFFFFLLFFHNIMMSDGELSCLVPFILFFQMFIIKKFRTLVEFFTVHSLFRTCLQDNVQ
jgi:hypothetical protein